MKEKPFDLDNFFKEQDERINLSESDWDEYEERRYLERKRKRDAERIQASAEESPFLPPSLSQIGREAAVALKKQKLTEEDNEPVEIAKRLETSPEDQLVSLGVPKASTSTAIASETTVSSHHRRKDITKLPKLLPKTRVSPEELSNMTTSFSSPEDDTNTRSTTSFKPILPNIKRTRTITEAIPIIKSSSTNIENKASTSRVKTVPASMLNRRRAKKTEDKEATMTPMEYAAILHEKWQSRISNTPPENLVLKGCTIFMVFEEKSKSTKDTRAKLDLLARNGAQVATTYDPRVVTHIIPGGSTITQKKILKAAKLKCIADIPSHVHTVNWDWIVSALTNGKRDSEIVYELYKERLPVYALSRTARNKSSSGFKDKGKETEKPRASSEELSIIEEFSFDKPSASSASGKQGSGEKDSKASTLSKASPDSVREDPLLPFYAKARAEAEHVSEDEAYRPLLPFDRGSKLKGFQCDKKSDVVLSESPNWDVIEKLAELREMHRELGTDDDKWRVLSYQKGNPGAISRRAAIGSLKSYPTRIRSKDEAMKLNGISSKTAEKIMEIIRTGELQRIKYTKTHDLESIRAFRGIYGVGSNIARKWVAQGYRDIDDLKVGVAAGKLKLTYVQEIGLRHYEDINDRMPRQEAAEIFIKIKGLALTLDPKLSLEIMGSFRRGKTTCGDIDILLTRPTDDGKTHAGVVKNLYDLLKKHNILCEDLALPDDWNALEITYRGLCCKGEGSRKRRIDILCVPYDSRGAARIYYTGDDIFNRSIRLKANKMGMSLNQRGLFQGVVRDAHDRTKKLCSGTLLCSDSERRIFEILGVPWQEPHERVRS